MSERVRCECFFFFFLCFVCIRPSFLCFFLSFVVVVSVLFCFLVCRTERRGVQTQAGSCVLFLRLVG